MSVALNISESCGKDSEAKFKRGLYVSMGSLKETDTLIDFSKDLNYIDEELYKKFKERIGILGKKINSFIQKLKKD